MKFLFHILYISQDGAITTYPSSKFSFIRIHHFLSQSSTNVLISLYSLAASRVVPFPYLPTSQQYQPLFFQSSQLLFNMPCSTFVTITRLSSKF